MRPFRPLPLLHGLALLVLFAFPWMTVSCPHNSNKEPPDQIPISGLELALVPSSMPKPQPPEGWPTPTNPPVKRDRPVLDAEHPSYWLIPLAAILASLLAFHRLRAAQNFRRAALLAWALACLALAQGAIRDARLYQGSPWGYRLEWRLSFWFTVALLPPLGLWAIGARPTQKPVGD